MITHAPIIHVLSYNQLSTSERPTMMPLYHLDRDDGPLAVPNAAAWFLMDQLELLEKYEQFIRDMIQLKHLPTQLALENIYNSAITTGVIIATNSQAIPFYTHAHVLRDIILELANGTQSKPDLCSICNQPQFETPHGVTCSNGHGGAEPKEKNS